MAIYKDLNDYEIMYLIEENENARDLLFEKYRPVVIKIASHYKEQAKICGLEMEDLIQEGYLGLYGAIKNYNSNNNTLFYTYAYVSIRSKILNSITSRSNDKHKCLNQSLSLFQPLICMKDNILMDFIEDKNELSPDFKVEEKQFENLIEDFLFSLEFPESLVFELKMNGFKNKDISELLDIPSKNVCNILFRTRKQLKECLKQNS